MLQNVSFLSTDTQNDDNLPKILRYNPLQSLSRVEASNTNGKETVYPIYSCHEKDRFFTTKANRTKDFQDVYGHINPKDGCYNILKLKVLDEKYVNTNNYLKAENSVSATTLTPSNNSNTDELMSKRLIKRDKMKHQKDLFQTLNSFKQKDTNERKRLRYSFVQSTELI